jgi:hypothetical protein
MRATMLEEIEKIEGTGILRGVGVPPDEWQVRYQIEFRLKMIKKPGFPDVRAGRSSCGAIRAINDDIIPEGGYQLTTDDGKIFRVKNLGFDWRVLS